MGDDFLREENLAGAQQGQVNDTGSRNSIVVPVTRDARFTHFRPDRLNIVHISANQSDKYELRLQSFVYQEKSQRIDLAPGSDLGVIGREVCMEVLELGTIDLTPQQMVKLRDDISREIGAAVAALPPALLAPRLEAAIAVQPNAQHLAPEAPPESVRPGAVAALATSTQPASKPHPLFDGASRQPLPRKQAGMGLSSAVAALAVVLVTGLVGGVVWFAEPMSHPESRSSRVLPSGGSAALGSSPAPAPPTATESAAPAHPDPVSAPETPASAMAMPPDAPRAAAPAPAEAQPAAPVQGVASPPAATPDLAANPPAAPDLGSASPSQAQTADPASDAAPAAAPLSTTAAPANPPAAPIPVPHLAVVVRASCWIIVSDASGKVVIEKLLKPGESWTAPSLPGLQLRTGNAGATSLVIDGAVGAPLGADNAIWTGPLDS